jgi:hypothetical protein
VIANDEFDVTDTPTDCIIDAGSPFGGGTTLMIANVGGTVIEFGGESLVWGNGIPIAAGAFLSIDNVAPDECFLVAEASGTARIAYKRNG